MLCWRKCQRIGRQGICIFLLALWIQIICFLAVTFRSEDIVILDSETESNSSSELAEENEVLDNIHSEEKSWKFQHFDVEKWNNSQGSQVNTFKLPDAINTDKYFRTLTSGQRCFIKGTDASKTPETASKCSCTKNYHGVDCGIPDSVWHGLYAGSKTYQKKLKIRPKMRRLIHAVPVNHEFDLFEARVKMLKDVVDVYLIQESNYTAYGSPKDLLFIERFKNGWLSEEQTNILWVFLYFFPQRGEEDGWYLDSFMRKYLSKEGLRLIDNQADDDIFLLLDADELPLPEVLLFLKLYDGYSEPIRFGFRWTVFGFYWLKTEEQGMLEKYLDIRKEKLLQLWVACTIGMLKMIYGRNSMLMRGNYWEHPKLQKYVQNYTSHYPTNVLKSWDIGKIGHYAGYHCSWCYNPAGIRTKLLSAQKHDSPRWGDFPEKTEAGYIANLIRNGEWFDGEKPFLKVEEGEEQFYAPEYILQHRQQFQYLLELPTQDL